MAIRNTYVAVDWAGEQIASLSHEHVDTAAEFQSLYAAGYRHFALSKYGEITYPLTVISGLNPGDIPADVVACPNAEHFGFTEKGHSMAGGSLLETPGSGTSGFEGSVFAWIPEVEANMLYPGKGFISENHPTLNNMGNEVAMRMYDATTLRMTMEVYNDLARWEYGGTGFALQNFHDVLMTGRHFCGLAAPDHWAAGAGDPGRPAAPRGFNRLLVPSGFSSMSAADKERECIEAYYEGRWYMSVALASPVLTGLTADADEVSITSAGTCDFEWVWARPGDVTGQVTDGGTGTSSTYMVRGDEVYVYARLSTSASEISLTQPIMYMDQDDIPQGSDTAKRLLLLGGGA